MLRKLPLLVLLALTAALLGLLLIPAAASPGVTTRVSVPNLADQPTLGTEGNAGSLIPAITADGRFVAFHSLASNLVLGDTNNVADVFILDRQTGTTERVSLASNGTEGDFQSLFPSISDDGRYVAFHSQASNLGPGDSSVFPLEDVFVHDRLTGATIPISVGTSGNMCNCFSLNPSISADGRFVAFKSDAWLLGVDPNLEDDVYVHDRDTDEDGIFDEPEAVATTRVSVDSAGVQGDDSSTRPAISADGRFVAFASVASNLVVGDTNNTCLGGTSCTDIFVHDRQTGATTRVSVDSAGNQGSCVFPVCIAGSDRPAISADGRIVAFESRFPDLVTGDTNNSADVFVHDRQTGATTRISVDSAGNQGHGPNLGPSVSGDGRFVAFYSTDDFVPGGLDWNVFVHDRQTGQTSRVSEDSAGNPGNDLSANPAVSGDGRFVAFDSDASNLVASDSNGVADVFTHDQDDSDGIEWNLDACPANPDCDADGFLDGSEIFVGTLPLVACPTTGRHDGIDNDGDTATDEPGEGANDEDPDPWPPDADDDQDADIGDVIILFSGKVLNPPAYVRRSDFDADGNIDIGDVIIAFGGTILTSCS